MTGLCLDAGALIAFERGDPRVRSWLRVAQEGGLEIHVVPEVVAQVWRDGARQARTAALLSAPEVTVPAYDEVTARAVGRLCGSSNHHDVVDVHVVLHARVHDQLVLTSDPDDLNAIDPGLRVVVV